jgi:hypothetical protein
MVNDLEMPYDFAGGRPQGNYRVGILVVTLALAAVKIGTRAAGGNKYQVTVRLC